METIVHDYPAEALKRFQELLARAEKSGLKEPLAVTLATVGAGGYPSARMVLLRGVDQRGFVFYTNLDSRKGREMEENPRAALCFYWDPLREQVRVEGSVEQVSDEEADAYWKTRAEGSQIGAWASAQSTPLRNQTELLEKAAQMKSRFAGGPIPRPPRWTGMRVVPDRIEFWKSGLFRLHRRDIYTKSGQTWTKGLLYP